MATKKPLTQKQIEQRKRASKIAAQNRHERATKYKDAELTKESIAAQINDARKKLARGDIKQVAVINALNGIWKTLLEHDDLLVQEKLANQRNSITIEFVGGADESNKEEMDRINNIEKELEKANAHDA